jgi:steroid delta-isomerase-like uncharacterized protein
MPRIVITHAVQDVDRWLRGKDERAAALPGAANVTDLVALDGSKQAGVSLDLDDVDALTSMLSSMPPDVAAQAESHGVVMPFSVFVQAEESATTDHSATMRRAYDLISEGDIDGFGSLVAAGFVEHTETPGLSPTKEGVLELFRGYRAAFPDMRMDVEEIIASGDRTVARVTVSGTHDGEFLGMPPSGRRVDVQLIDIMRFDDAGLIAEHWGVVDMLSMLQQLGAMPQDAPTT